MYSTANGVATDAKSAESATIHPLAESSVGKLIQVIRGKQVLLDRDLATLYGVETRRINEQVKRNFERFPEDFCFQLTISEVPERLKSQIATLNNKGNQRGLRTQSRIRLPRQKTEAENKIKPLSACGLQEGQGWEKYLVTRVGADKNGYWKVSAILSNFSIYPFV